MSSPTPTPHPEVNSILARLQGEIRQILQAQLVGLYLFGSLANGDFDRHSDIDVLVVTQTDLDEETFQALRSMHQSIAQLDSAWAVQQEVSYIPCTALRRFDAAHNLHPHLDRGAGETLQWRAHESDWVIQRYGLRAWGIVIEGPRLTDLIDPVLPDDLRHAVAEILHKWIGTFLDEPSRLDSRGYQSYTVLTLCRILYTHETGEVLSKRAAAAWAREHLPAHWRPLIDRAWEGRQNSSREVDPIDRQDTLDLIRFALERIP